VTGWSLFIRDVEEGQRLLDETRAERGDAAFHIFEDAVVGVFDLFTFGMMGLSNAEARGRQAREKRFRAQMARLEAQARQLEEEMKADAMREIRRRFGPELDKYEIIIDIY